MSKRPTDVEVIAIQEFADEVEDHWLWTYCEHVLCGTPGGMDSLIKHLEIHYGGVFS